MKANSRKPISVISAMHYWKLLYRAVLFLGAAALYILGKVREADSPFGALEERQWFLLLIWLVFAVEMVLRFFPSKTESMGCQKQFARCYLPKDGGSAEIPARMPGGKTALIAGLWLLLNGLLGALYFCGCYDEGVLLLVSLAFSVCDMICILFFCPFQTWIMKNKCCTTCRIYNWDYAMMFTPLLFIPSLYTWSLLGLALVLLVIWEGIYHRHPERFYEQTNESLKCVNCPEKLCHHKKQLSSFLKKRKIELSEELEKLGLDRQ